MNRLVITALLLLAADTPATQPQLVMPCRVVSVHDGDTVTVEVTLRANVRLLDCWAPELREPGGQESRREMERIASGKTGTLTIPLGDDLGDSLNLGRVLGRIAIDGRDVSEHMVATKHATKDKKGIE